MQVVNSHCGQYLGAIRKVVGLVQADNFCCSLCDKNIGPLTYAEVEMDAGSKLVWPPVAWLKRIPPLQELEGAKTEESLRVPAQPRVKA